MFKGVKPAAQPRTLRTIAERNEGANFPDPRNFEDSVPGVDAADVAKPTSGKRALNAGDKQPFAGVRGGR